MELRILCSKWNVTQKCLMTVFSLPLSSLSTSALYSINTQQCCIHLSSYPFIYQHIHPSPLHMCMPSSIHSSIYHPTLLQAPFHPSIHLSIPSSTHPSQYIIGRVYQSFLCPETLPTLNTQFLSVIWNCLAAFWLEALHILSLEFVFLWKFPFLWHN